MRQSSVLPAPQTRPAPLRSWPGILAVGLVLAGCARQPTPAPPPLSATPQLPTLLSGGRALVNGPVSSPVFDALKSALTLTTYTGSQKVGDYDLVIVDGDAHSAEDLKNDKLVHNAFEAGKWVLGVDLSPEEKQTGLHDLIHVTSKKTAAAFMFRKEPTADGRAAYRILESTPLDVSRAASSGPSSPAARLTTLKADPAIFAAAAVKALKGNPGGKVGARDATGASDCGSMPAATASQNVGASGSTPSPDQPFPTDLIYYVVYYCNLSAQKVILPTSLLNPNFQQTASAVFNTTFTVALNNKVHPLGDFQFVMVQSDTSSTPALDGFANQSKAEYAWFQDQITHDVTPQNTGAFNWVSNGPNAANADNIYTASSGFEVGFEGLGGTGSYSWENGTEYSVPDWKVSSSFDASANHAGWDFRSGTPDADVLNGFAWYDSFYFTVLTPNPLSLSQNVLHTSVTYKTPVLDSGQESFNVAQSLRFYDISCTPLEHDKYCGDFPVPPVRTTESLVMPVSDLFTVDLSAVIPDPVKDISFAQNPVTPGATVTGRVILTRPAPIDTLVSLSTNTVNSNASIVTSPVIVKQGETSATFTVLTNGNAIENNPGDQVVVPITAFNVQAFTKQLTLRYPRIASLAFNPGIVTASTPATLTVTTDIPVLADTVVMLRSDKAFATPATPTVTIPRGASTATVAVQTGDLSPGSTAAATFTASIPGQDFQATLTVTNPVIQGVAFSPNPVAGGGAVTGTLTLTAPATVDTVLPLSVDGANAKLPEASVRIARGQPSGTFQLQTTLEGLLQVGASTTATVTSSYGGQSAQSPRLTIVNPRIKSFTHAPDSVTAGQPVTVTVTMDRPVGVDTVIRLYANSLEVKVPPSVTVPAGQTSASFTAQTIGTYIIPGDSRQEVVQATYADQQELTYFTVTLPSTAFKSFTLDPNPVVAGQKVRGTITLTEPAPVGINITVSSSSTNVYVDPLAPQIFVNQGNTTAYVLLDTSDAGLKAGNSLNVTLTATSSAFPNQHLQAQLTVGLPKTATIASISFSPNPVTAGQTTTATVTLSAPAPETTDPLVEYSTISNHTPAYSATRLEFIQGKTTASFQIATNGSNLPSGSYPVTVTVAYPYAQTFDAKFALTVP